MNKLRIFIGYDKREQAAYDVAVKTARSFGCDTQPLYEDRLRMAGLLTRPVDTRGTMWDFVSSANQSTEFANSRFFVPILAHSGWCLFADCDVVFLSDPNCLWDIADSTKAVQVVKHQHMELDKLKMDGQVQSNYHRKLWSSVILWNLDHKANRRINLTMLNSWPGRDLHAFGWLNDNEIGELPPEANWLVGLQPKPETPIIAHYTLGTPCLPGFANCEHADLWWEAARSQPCSER